MYKHMQNIKTDKIWSVEEDLIVEGTAWLDVLNHMLSLYLLTFIQEEHLDQQIFLIRFCQLKQILLIIKLYRKSSKYSR